jgi:hypothetical protein
MDNFDLKKYLAEGKLNEAPSMRAYQIAKDLITNMDLPEDAVADENLFLDVVKALNGQLYEKAADMFDKRAGAASDEY